jgi:hypothetical protein
MTSVAGRWTTAYEAGARPHGAPVIFVEALLVAMSGYAVVAPNGWSAGAAMGLAHDVSQFRKNGEAILGGSTPMVGAVIRPRQRSVIGAGEGVAIGRMTEY